MPAYERWIGMLTAKAVRGRLIAVLGLGLVLIALLVVWLPWNAREESLPDLIDFAPTVSVDGPAAMLHAAVDPAPLLGDAAAQRNAAAPFQPLGPAARPFHFAGGAQDRGRARACLAAAMFYEAGNDTIGQLAVGQVVLNRARHPAFPASVCGVVAQGSERVTGCQFTFTCDGALARRASAAARDRALAHADLMLDGLVFAGVGLATHYHTSAVYPWWSGKLEKIARVGTHLFFRWPGRWGGASAFGARRVSVEPSASLFAGFAGDDALAATPTDGQGDAAGQVAVAPTSTLALRPGGERLSGGSTLALSDRGAAIPMARRLPATAAPEVPGAPVVVGPALEGNTLLRMFPQDNVFYLELAAGSNDGARRRVARMLCGGRAECRVYGWRKAADAPTAPDPDTAARNAAFTYVRAAVADRRPAASAVGAM